MKNNQIKQKILINFAVFAVFILGIIIIPKETSADRPGWYVGYNNPTNTNYYPNYYYYPPQNYYYPPQNTYINPTSAPTVYSDTTNPDVRSTSNRKVATATKTASTKSNPDIGSIKDLTVSTIFGSDSFLPSGIIQWLFFSILILLSILLVRKVYSGDKNYYATPMKHD